MLYTINEVNTYILSCSILNPISGTLASTVAIFGGGDAAGSLLNIEVGKIPAVTSPSNNFFKAVDDVFDVV